MFLFFPHWSLPAGTDGVSSWHVNVRDASVVFLQLEGSIDGDREVGNIPFCSDSFQFYYLTKIFHFHYTVLGRCDPDKWSRLSHSVYSGVTRSGSSSPPL